MKSLANPIDCNCLAVRQAARYITQFYDQHLAAAGLRTSQFGVLATLASNGPLAINELAAKLVMDRTTLGRNIRPLERDGLVNIEPDPSDGRSKTISLSKTGEVRLSRARAGWAEAQKQFEQAYGRKHAAQLRAQLHAVVASDLGPLGEATA